MEYEIRNCKSSDIASLKLLWEDVFNDEEKYITRFFDTVFTTDSAFVAIDSGMPVGMMFMLPATLTIGNESFNAGYIYAVATDKNYRGQGIMTAMESYVCYKALNSGISVLVLVPANKSLFNMYKKIGYKTAFYRSSTVIAPKPYKKSQLLDCTLDNFLELRKNMLNEHQAYFELDDILKKYRYETVKQNGEVLLYTDDVNCGYIVGQKQDNHYIILETSLPIDAVGKAAYTISEKYYKLKKVSVFAKNGTLIPYGMIKTLDSRVNIDDVVKLNPYMNLMLE